MFFRASILTRALFAASNTAFTVSKAAMAGSMHITLLFSHRIESGIYAVWWAGWAILKKLRDRNTEMMQKFCKFRNLMHEPEMRLARSPILCSKLTMMTVLDVRARRDKKIRNSAFQRCYVMKEFLLELDYVFVGLLLCSRMRFPLTAERLRF